MSAEETVMKMLRAGAVPSKTDVMKIFLEKADALVRADRAKGKKKTPEIAFDEVFNDPENDHVKKLYFGSPDAAPEPEVVTKNLPASAVGRGYDQLMAKARELVMADRRLTIEQAFAKAYEDPANRGPVGVYKSEMAAAAA